MQQGNYAHFPTCQSVANALTTSFPREGCAEKLKKLKAEFSRRFADFETQKFSFELFTNPFGVDVDRAPEHLQRELIELQCNGALEAKFDYVGAGEFAPFIQDMMPQLRLQAARVLSMFGSTHLCEQMFSVMKINKSSHRSRLTDKHLASVIFFLRPTM